MTQLAPALDAAPSLPTRSGTFSRPFRDVAVLTRRNLIHIAREPLQLSDVLIQPVLFTLLFIYVLGSGISLPGGSYKEFAVAGLVTLNLTTSVMGTAVGLTTDLNTGTIDRLRALPIWRASVLVSRSVADILSAVLCTTMVLLTGLVIGWRPHTSVPEFIAGLAIPLLFSYALIWATACLGMVTEGPESAQGIGLVILFPLAIVSNAMVPTSGMPSFVRVIADWNPVSSVAAAMRQLFGNPNPSAAAHAWPMQHPIAAAILWSVAILAVTAPLAVHLYRRRTTD
ncbi:MULTISPECIES: ABC transporter permease [Pseudofrankia]|uniref:ABC transporter permease n=1 Tax=Pseudofrankia TaxID=2994363 RepID=UPI000234CB62|nr:MULTISPECIES: ABC transporter permease [Pseudofrankia]OHV34426.1 ABC transporter [Pseudofrankia sp. EUN1h]